MYTVTFLYDVSDYDAYLEYGEKARDVVIQYGGRFIVTSYMHYDITLMEGEKPDIVNIAIFSNTDKYLAFYHSEEYQKLKLQRDAICRSQIIMLGKNDEANKTT